VLRETLDDVAEIGHGASRYQELRDSAIIRL
jgi:hypothetical protein